MEKDEFNQISKETFQNVFTHERTENLTNEYVEILDNNSLINAVIFAQRDLPVQYVNELVYNLISQDSDDR